MTFTLEHVWRFQKAVGLICAFADSVYIWKRLGNSKKDMAGGVTAARYVNIRQFESQHNKALCNNSGADLDTVMQGC